MLWLVENKFIFTFFWFGDPSHDNGATAKCQDPTKEAQDWISVRPYWPESFSIKWQVLMYKDGICMDEFNHCVEGECVIVVWVIHFSVSIWLNCMSGSGRGTIYYKVV